MDNNEELTFEQTFAQLESIVARLEAGDLSLEEALDLFDLGQKLARRCGEMLDSADLRVQQLGPDGSLGPLE